MKNFQSISEVKNNWESNGVIDLSAIMENLNMLENEERS